MGTIALPRPTIVFVAGGPCTGKTTLLNELLLRLDRVMLVDKDDISDPMMMTPNREATDGKYDLTWMMLNGPRHSITGEHYRDHIGMQTYRAMIEVAMTNLTLGLSPFLQGNYTAQIKQGYFKEVVDPLLKQNDIYGYKLILCHADPEEIKARIRQRNDPRDASKLVSQAALDDYVAKQDFVPAKVDTLSRVKLDSSRHTVEENVKLAIEYLLR